MKKLIKKLLFLTFFLGLVFVIASFTRSIFAQNVSPATTANQETPEESARKHGVTFPIAELGGCKSLAECRSFCEDPVNQNVCVDFAKKKGFYKEEKIEQNQEILTAAKTELGCTDFASCQVTCQKEENLGKCDTFAKKHNLGGGEVADPKKQEIIQKAKTILGCDSPDSCRTVCQQETNRQKCDEFAKQSGLRGGEHRVGPGGCTSETTCKAFCSDPNNYQVCSGFSKGEGAKFTGPGGCNSEDSCKNYCQQHSQECKFGGQGQIGGPNEHRYNPQEMCLRSPSCQWNNNSCQCGIYNGGQFDSFCKEHPDQCKPGQGAGSPENERARDSFEQFCKQNPEKCKSSEDNSRKADQYAKLCREHPDQCKPGSPGSFDSVKSREEFEKNCRENPEKCKTSSYGQPNSSTQQNTAGGNNPPNPAYQQQSMSPADACQKSPGCRWENGGCQCGSTNYKPTQDRPPEYKPPEQQKPPENNPPPEYKPPEVKGESTSAPNDMVQIIIQVLTNLLKGTN